MRLIDAVRYSHGSNIAFVGAGGKTTAIFRAAREILAISDSNWSQRSVFVTTSTHLGAWQSAYADHSFQIGSSSDINELENHLPQGVVLFSAKESHDRLAGLTRKQLEQLCKLATKYKIPMLLEADGSRLHPLKAPTRHEPVIPGFVENVIVVAGMQGLGKPLTSKWVHRPEKFAELSGLKIRDLITQDALVKVLLHQQGGLKDIPAKARRIALLNQADTPDLQSQAKKISDELIHGYHSSIVSALSPGIEGTTKTNKGKTPQARIYAVVEPIAGIILAAGGSKRFGQPKQLLDWQGQPVVRRVALTALQVGLSPVIVVVGAAGEGVASVIKDLPLRIVINEKWDTGLSSSIKEGINSLPKEVGGIIFLQGDQPQIPPSLVRSLVETHQNSLNPIVAPLIDGQRGNPVLFDRITLQAFETLNGEMGGRELFSRFQVQRIIWHDKNLLLDIDTPGDYENLLAVYPVRKAKL
jgi:molybdenum cofactor cytidylyltransferase